MGLIKTFARCARNQRRASRGNQSYKQIFSGRFALIQYSSRIAHLSKAALIEGSVCTWLSCARGRVVLSRSRGRPPNPPSPPRSASPLRLAFLCVRACRVESKSGETPEPPPLRCARPLRCAWLSCACGRVMLSRSRGSPPNPPLS